MFLEVLQVGERDEGLVNVASEGLQRVAGVVLDHTVAAHTHHTQLQAACHKLQTGYY